MSLTQRHSEYNVTEKMQPNSYIIYSSLKDHPRQGIGVVFKPPSQFPHMGFTLHELEKVLRVSPTGAKVLICKKSSEPNVMEIRATLK